MDYSALSVKKAKEYNQVMIDKGRCKVIQGDVSKLPLEADSFELVTAFETIYFWPGLEKCFSQVANILKDGGCFMICNESDGTDKTSKKFESIIDGMHCYTPEEITKALKAAGFSKVRSAHHPSKPWITVDSNKISCFKHLYLSNLKHYSRTLCLYYKTVHSPCGTSLLRLLLR